MQKIVFDGMDVVNHKFFMDIIQAMEAAPQQVVIFGYRAYEKGIELFVFLIADRCYVESLAAGAPTDL